MSLRPLHAAALAAGLNLHAGHAAAAEAASEAWNLHGQSTYIWQAKPAFASRYEGANSLMAAHEKSYSFTATAGLGLRGWRGAEFYFDAELVQGIALSGLAGLGGLSNSELQKTAGSNPLLYRARAFLRQSWNLSADAEPVESSWHQLGGPQARQRIVLTVGRLAVTDLFDNNAYAHDARTQFLNWSLLTHGAFDYAADSRGYSEGAALEWFSDDWALRGARFAVPRESNGLALDSHVGMRHGDQIEVEHRHRIGGHDGAVRLLVFRNAARMARFDDALAAAAPGSAPTLDAVRRANTKRGLGIAVEQAFSDTLGGFARASRHDGATEPYSFTSIDNAVSAGIVLRGQAWSRAGDTLGVAWASSGLSASHRRFLQAGGSDFFIGDGALRYGREQVLEATYSAALGKGFRLALDLQRIANPAYNRDRGPAPFIALRLHAEL